MFGRKWRRSIEVSLAALNRDMIVLQGQMDVLKHICSPIFNSSGDITKLATEVRLAEAKENANMANIEKAQDINEILASKGEQIRSLHQKIHDTMIVAERHGEDIRDYKARLEILDWIIGGLK